MSNQRVNASHVNLVNPLVNPREASDLHKQAKVDEVDEVDEGYTRMEDRGERVVVGREKVESNGNPSSTRQPRQPADNPVVEAKGPGEVMVVSGKGPGEVRSLVNHPSSRGKRLLARQHDLAIALGVTDKRVATWRTRSAVNGFPAPYTTYSGTLGPGRPGARNLWDLREVLTWFERYDIAEQQRRSGAKRRGVPQLKRASQRSTK